MQLLLCMQAQAVKNVSHQCSKELVSVTLKLFGLSWSAWVSQDPFSPL